MPTNPHPYGGDDVARAKWRSWNRGNSNWNVSDQPAEPDNPHYMEGWHAAADEHRFRANLAALDRNRASH